MLSMDTSLNFVVKFHLYVQQLCYDSDSQKQ